MNAHSLIPLAASIAYIPLLALLFANRPWQNQKKLFAIFLLAAMLWSLGDFLFRSDFLINEKMLLAKGILCTLVLSVTQLHYFLRTYYEPNWNGFPVAYALMAVDFAIVLLFVPQDIITGPTIVPVYGPWLYPLALYLYGLLGWDMYKLIGKLRSTTDPVSRNHILYIIIGLLVAVFFATSSFSKLGQEIPLAHVGNLANALILTYAVMRFRLLDLRIVLRRGLAIMSMIAVCAALFLIVYVIGHFLFKVELDDLNFILGIAVAFVMAVVVYQIKDFTAAQIDRLFYRDSYGYRLKLEDFVQKRIRGVIDLNDFGNELLTLLSGSIRCGNAYLMLPREETSDFYIRYVYPSQVDRPSFIIKNDSPLLHWLRKKKKYLPREKIDIEPEFKGLWKEEREKISQLNIQLLLPISSRNKIIGILALGEKLNNGIYRLDDINLAEKVIKEVATTLEKEYLQDQLRSREQELSLINRLAGVITSSLNIQEVYDVFVIELKEVVEADYTAICVVEDKNIYFATLTTDVGSAWHIGQTIPMSNTAIEWVYLNKKYFYESDLSQSKRFWMGDEFLKRGIRSMLYLPMINKGEVIGVLNIGSRKPNSYSVEKIVLLERLASQIAAPIENTRLFAKSEEAARVDSVTGLFNRRHFDERLRSEIDRHSRYGDILSILMLDLDNFKKYNDTYGHLAGDRLLAQAGNIISSAIRSSDLAFRYGGDEFAVILPNSPTMDAFSVAERIREKIGFEMASRQLDISISIGVASWPGDGSTLDELCYAADMALYYAKHTGQNRTSVASRTLFSLSEPAVSAKTEDEALSTIYALAATLEARDKYTYGHSRRVSRYSVAVAEAMNLPPEQVALISAAALLHDIGKIGIPDSVLNKSEKLLDEEWEMLKQHPRLSATIIGHVPSLSACLAAIRHHHERWDGKGYPAGLKAEAIPLEARILCVTDAFEAMISDRPYRGPLSFKQAIAELKRCAGSQFDPGIVRIFIPIALATCPDDVELELPRSRREKA